MDRPEQTLVPPFVMVVQRGDDERYELLRKLFQSQRVDVVLDRRGGDRRAAAGTDGTGHLASLTRATGNGGNGANDHGASGTGANGHGTSGHGTNGQNGNGAGAALGERRGGERRAVLPDTWVNLGFFVARRQLRS